MIVHKHGGHMEKQSVQFQNINVNSLSSNSGVFVGNNNQKNFYSFSKENSGLVVSGQRNFVARNLSLVKN